MMGRRFYLDGRLVESKGGTSYDTHDEEGDCAGKQFCHLVYWTGDTATPIPERNMLYLLSGLLGALAGWIV